MRRTGKNKNCIICGKEFYKPKCLDRVKCCSRECSNESKKGKPAWNKGLKMGDDFSQKCRLSHIGISYLNRKKPGKFSEEHLSKLKGRTPWNKGKTNVYTEDTIKAIRKARLNQRFNAKETKIEKITQSFLEKMGLQFESQVPLEGVTIADFYLRNSNTVIFCDGDYWHRKPEVAERDRRQNKILKEAGYRVIRLWEKDILNYSDKCFKEALCV